jgi:hypothetical protein
MGELIRPNKVTVLSKDGEVTLNITIDLNLNLNTANVAVEAEKKIKEVKKEIEGNDDDKVTWAIPSFDSSEKLKF